MKTATTQRNSNLVFLYQIKYNMQIWKLTVRLDKIHLSNHRRYPYNEFWRENF